MKDITTGKQMWLQTVWDQGIVGPNHHSLETSELVGFDKRIQESWTNAMTKGPHNRLIKIAKCDDSRKQPKAICQTLGQEQ